MKVSIEKLFPNKNQKFPPKKKLREKFPKKQKKRGGIQKKFCQKSAAKKVHIKKIQKIYFHRQCVPGKNCRWKKLSLGKNAIRKILG